MKRRIVCSVMGLEGHGKTDFWTTAMQPIMAVACDPNTEDVVCKVFKVEDLEDLEPSVCRVVQAKFPAVGLDDEDTVATDATESWDAMTSAIIDVIRDKARPRPKSVVLDSGTEIDAMNVLSRFGRTDRISPNMRRNNMGELNNRFRGLFRGLERAGVHVIITHRAKQKWETVEVRTPQGTKEEDHPIPGEYERIGFKQMGNLVNVEVLVMFDPTRQGKLREKFGMRVTRSMQRPALVGREWWGMVEIGDRTIRAASFPHLGVLLYPETSLEDWE